MQNSNQPYTQEHLQEILLRGILQELGRIDTEAITALYQEIQNKCPKLNMGDEHFIWVNPDDLTIEFIPKQEIPSEILNSPHFSETWHTCLLEETDNDDICIYIAIY